MVYAPKLLNVSFDPIPTEGRGGVMKSYSPALHPRSSEVDRLRALRGGFYGAEPGELRVSIRSPFSPPLGVCINGCRIAPGDTQERGPAGCARSCLSATFRPRLPRRRHRASPLKSSGHDFAALLGCENVSHFASATS
jgi:hypothetical protein